MKFGTQPFNDLIILRKRYSMKRQFFLFLLVVITISCSNDDDTLDSRLAGQWNLIYVSCECQPVDLEIGQHLWNFDIATSTLTVQNNVLEDLHTIPDTGVYNITLTNNTITLLSVTYDYYFNEEGLIVQDHPEADGPQIQLVRD